MDVIYNAMQRAVDTVPLSPHKINKIAACFWGTNLKGKPFLETSSNFYPKDLETYVQSGKRFQGKSGYIHAELGAILKQKGGWQEAFIAITDPPCPNCMKHIDSAGIKAVYIDHKGFEKDFFQRRITDFTKYSLGIAEETGISLFKVYRKEKKIIPILLPEIQPERKSLLEGAEALQASREDKGDHRTTLFHCTKEKAQEQALLTEDFSYQSKKNDDFSLSSRLSGKFDFQSSPLPRAVILAAKKGYCHNEGELTLNYEPKPSDLIFLLTLQPQTLRIWHGGSETLLSPEDILQRLAAMAKA